MNEAIVVWRDSANSLRWLIVIRQLVPSVKLELRKMGTPAIAVIRPKLRRVA